MGTATFEDIFIVHTVIYAYKGLLCCALKLVAIVSCLKILYAERRISPAHHAYFPKRSDSSVVLTGGPGGFAPLMAACAP